MCNFLVQISACQTFFAAVYHFSSLIQVEKCSVMLNILLQMIQSQFSQVWAQIVFASVHIETNIIKNLCIKSQL